MTEQETPEQKQYREGQTSKGLWLSGGLFLIFAVLKYSNVKAEKKEILERRAQKKARKEELEQEIADRKLKAAEEGAGDEDIEGIREWDSDADGDEYDNRLR